MSTPPVLHDDPAAWVADDLTRAERQAFADHLANDPTAQREVVFWQRIRPTFADRTPASDSLGSGFAAAILARAHREQSQRPRQLVIRLPMWTATVVSLAAAALIVALLLPSAKPTEAGMWLEDGSAVSLQASGDDWSDYMPRALVHQVSHREPSQSTEHGRERPWLGLWSRPVDVVDNGTVTGTGHLVLRVVSGSPADRIGLRPGDVISTVDGCRLFSSQCIAHRLDDARPGQSMVIEWFRPGSGEQFSKPLVLEAVFE